MRLFISILCCLSASIIQAQDGWDVIWSETDTFGMTMSDMDVYDHHIARFIGQGPEGHFFLSTEDGGANWDTVFFDSDLHLFKSMSFTSENEGYILSTGFQETNGDEHWAFKVLKTLDAGQNWKQIFASPPDLPWIFSGKMNVDFLNADTGVITTQTAGLLTTNGSMSWEILPEDTLFGRYSVMVDDMFASFNGSVSFYSVDSLSSFTRKTVFNGVSGFFGDLYKGSNDIISLYAAGMGIYGTDLGYPQFNFGVVSIGELEETITSVIHFPYSGKIWDIDRTPNYIYLGGRPLFGVGSKFMKSEDFGETWYAQGLSSPEPIDWPFIEQIECINDTICFAYSATNIYRTLNGGGPLLELIETINIPVVLGVEEISHQLSIYPNPTNDILNIHSEFLISEISIFDIQGKIVQRKVNSPSNNWNIDISKLNSGMYLLMAEFEKNDISISRFLKE